MLTRLDWLLRIESLAGLTACVIAYSLLLHGRWWVFAVLFLAPDLSLLGYAVPGRPGMAAGLYNAVHSYVGPAALGLAAWRSGFFAGEAFAVIWGAHIAFDRVLGFGLKFREGFKPTHMQRAGVWG